MSLLAQINNAAHTGAFGHNPRSEPTLAQLAAGNYKKGVVMVKGLSIAIENPAYTYRKGMDKTGQQWMCLMQAHYGYIQGYKGNDGDDMDVFIGVAPENDTVYIVNQKTADGYFDEHKIMLGFLSQQQAVDTYQHCFERGMTGLMSVVPCTVTQFKWWLANGNKSRPVTLDRLPYAGLERLDSVNWGGTDGSNLYSHDGQVHKLLYQIRQCDDTHQALEPLAYHDMIAELGNQGFMYENYDALIVEYNKLEKKAKQLLMVMQGAADTVKPVGVTVSKPLTKGGVANVVAWFEMDDGQAVGVFFHNPDKTPKKINPTDEMISYKWVLNKKDITIAVAPEQGKDLVIRTVAKRIMQLVEKNHDRFVKANGDKAALNQTEQDLSAQVAEKQATLKGLQDEVVALQARKAEKEAAQLAQEKVIEPVVQEPEATLSNRFAEHDAIAKQYGYSVNSSGVIFTPKGKNTGVKIGSPAGRLKISNAKELLFSGVNPTGLGKFLESYWYAEKTKAVVVPTVSAEQEPVTIESQSMITVWDSQQADADFAVILAQHNGDYVAASKVYFAEKLLGTSVQTKIGKVWINDTTKRKMQHRLSKTKARVVNRIPEILIDGSVGERTPLDKQRDDKIVAFYQFDKWLDFDDVRIHARIKVGEVSKGKLAYYLAASANEEAPSFDSSGADSDESLQPKGLRETRLDSIQADDDDDVNIEILEVVSKVKPVEPATEERPSNWRTNLANARAVAKSLGIETKGKKLANLVGEVDVFDANKKPKTTGKLSTPQELAQVAENQGILKGLQDDVVALQGRKVEKEEIEAPHLRIYGMTSADHDKAYKVMNEDKTGQTVISRLTEDGSAWVLKSSSTRSNEGVHSRFGKTTITGAELIQRFETKEDAEKWAVENGYKVAGKETPKHLKDIIFSWDGNAEQQKLKSILANNPNLIQAYNQYFNENLQGKSVMTSIGKVWITGETRTEMRNRLTKFKAMIIPYVPEILIHGKVGTEKANKDATEPKKAKYESFIPFQHSVTIDGLEVLAMVQVGKMKSDGKLAYSLNVNQNQEVFDSMDEKAIFSPSQVVQEDQQGYRAVKNSLDSITAQDDGEINIEILSVYDRRTGKSLTENEAEKLLFGEQAVELAINGKSTLSANQQPEPVTLTGKELGDFADTPEGKKALRAAAKAEFEKLLGQWVDCPALGGKVELRKSGMKKVLSLSADSRKLEIIPMLKSLISSSVKVDSVKSNDALIEQNIKAYHILRSKVTLDNELLAVRLVIREDDKGQYHYDHAITESLAEKLQAEKSLSEDRLDSMTATNGWGVADDSVKPTNIVRHQLDSILDSGAWVVNLFIEGEPLEVLEEETTPNPDRDYLQSIIDGKADLEAKGITTKIRQIILTAKDASDTDMLELADKAARAYATYVKAKAVAKLAEVQ